MNNVWLLARVAAWGLAHLAALVSVLWMWINHGDAMAGAAIGAGLSLVGWLVAPDMGQLRDMNEGMQGALTRPD